MVPGRRYPVFQHTYAGMGVAQVRNAWAGTTYLFHQMLAQQGIVVWILDNRSASSKGVAAQWQVYERLGELELRDLEDGIAWLVDQGLADPARVGLWGWSYGGFMTAYALTHSEVFSCGVIGAPVTDWRLYDTIYTERYMDTPQANPEGYDRTSVVQAAEDLHGKALIIHGAIDENVHMQNSLQLANALQDAGHLFELMLYPGNRHGVVQPRQRRHLYAMMADFFRRNL
jgi:dipeptidyl-peptidase-4